MSYTIESEIFVFENKKKGDQITEKELLEAGLNIDALVGGNHLSSKAQPKSAPDKGADE